MRRAVLAVISSFIGLIALLSYRTPITTASAPNADDSTPPVAAIPSTTTSTPEMTIKPETPDTKHTGTTEPVRTTTTTTPTRVITGSTENTKYGPMQVSATLQGHKILDVKVLKQPNEPGSAALNAKVFNKLHTAVLSAQSAKVAAVSGATDTSNGYTQSLQSALNQAG
jgi:uncharacterized protein with FMN-binding domain